MQADMGRIISIVNQKGGVGKTTTAVNLASCFASLGQRVLLIDLDSQGNATSGIGVDVNRLEHTMYDVLMQHASLASVIRSTVIDNFHIAPSNVDLAGATVELVPVEGREYRLREAVDSIKAHYDIILIDCPPTLGLLTINGLVGSDEVLIPVQTEYYALEGLGQLLQTVTLVKEHLRPELTILGAVLTMYDKRNKLSDAVFNDIYQYFPNKVFGTVIPRNVRVAEAPSHGMPVVEYDRTSKGAKAYKKLAREILVTLPGSGFRTGLDDHNEFQTSDNEEDVPAPQPHSQTNN